mgnify:CR=1 FL=1
MLKNYKELNVWQKSYELCLKIYGITTKFPNAERYGLTSQVRRSAVSIPSNIAEGYGRFEKRDKTRFYKISRGSGYELMSQLIASFKLEYIKEKIILDEIISDTTEIVNELTALIISLERKAGVADD